MKDRVNPLAKAIQEKALAMIGRGQRDPFSSQAGVEMWRNGDGEVLVNEGAAHIRVVRISGTKPVQP